MPNTDFQPVRHDSAQSLTQAKKRLGFQAEWDALEEEYILLDALLAARHDAGLTQEALANKMGTTKSAISRLESSLRDDKHSPSFATLKKYANACGKKLYLQLV
jgi:DNA-binding XRE family transcriptional regulator